MAQQTISLLLTHILIVLAVGSPQDRFLAHSIPRSACYQRRAVAWRVHGVAGLRPQGKLVFERLRCAPFSHTHFQSPLVGRCSRQGNHWLTNKGCYHCVARCWTPSIPSGSVAPSLSCHSPSSLFISFPLHPE